MRFWDTSAIVPLLGEEASSRNVFRQFERDPEIVVWWGTELECVSALARRERDGSLGPSMRDALTRLDSLSLSWTEVEPGQHVRQIAIRLLRVHPLRAADALQLAAAIVASEDRPATLTLVTIDERLSHAAEREGLPTTRPDLP